MRLSNKLYIISFLVLVLIILVWIIGFSNPEEVIDNIGVQEEHEFPEIIEGIKKMVLVPKGLFLMGQDSGFEDELPIHEVFIDPFYIDETPVTYEDFQKYIDVGGVKSKYWEYDTYNKPDQPVTGLDWYHAADYCNWRSSIEGLDVVYEKTNDLDAWGYQLINIDYSANGYRLPTEAEFEYTARGGLDSKKFPWGDDFSEALSNFDNEKGLMEGDWWRLSGVKDQPANNYGAYGMSGNVWQFCNDWYKSDYYIESVDSNPRGPENGRTKVIRGGSWGSVDPTYLRVAKRSYTAPSNYNYDIGFRCMRPATEEVLDIGIDKDMKYDFYQYKKSYNDEIEIDNVYSDKFINRLTQYIRDHYSNSIYFRLEIDDQEIIAPKEIVELIVKVSQEHQIHPLFLTGIMISESGFGSCSFPRWYNNPMAYHWQNILMSKGLPVYESTSGRNRKYKDLETAFNVFSQGIRRNVYFRAAKNDLDAFHLVYVGYRADEWMYTISKVYKDVLGIQLEPDFPLEDIGELIYMDWDSIF